MSLPTAGSRRRRRSDARGFSLIELMVALVVGMFLLLALYSVFATVRTTLQAQQGLAQLQEDERVAMTMLANAVQSAGYFPSPTTSTRAAAFPVAGAFASAGQIVVGTSASAPPGDTLTLRFVGDATTPAKAIDCVGTAGTPTVLETNQLLVTASKQLGCSVNGAPSQPLVGGTGMTPQGIQSMQVLYGIDTTGAKSVTRYMSASAVTASGVWNAVLSVSITLNFVNSRAAQSGEPATFAITRVIALQNNLL